ncbi:MAG: glucose-6-phosphate isomerase [Desulfovibrionaceae bacterium]|nr:glucose-6-phosphate isomerase [Desulfovibrionaceae bacterium]
MSRNKNRLVWTGAWPFDCALCAAHKDNCQISNDNPAARKNVAARLLAELQSGSLPFVSLDYASGLCEQLQGLCGRLEPFKHLLLLGIGGSALGARALQKAFYPQQDWPGHADAPNAKYLWVADNIDPESLPQWFDRLPAIQTLVVVISKSGGTIETMSQYFLAKNWLQSQLGPDWQRHMLLITDARKGFLREEADTLGLASLPVPENLGGRYSVLSAVGLLPAMFLGINWEELLAGAKELFAPLNLASTPDDMEKALSAHPAWNLAVWAALMQDKGFNELIYFTYVPKLAAFGAWFAQLWAESLGKDGKGSMPLPATGVTDQHSLQQMFLDGPNNKACLFISCPNLPDGSSFPTGLDARWEYLAGKSLRELLLAETLGSKMALSDRKIPLLELELALPDEFNTGKLISLLGLATIFTGWMMGINPQDQPAVELGKRLAKASLGADNLESEKEMLMKFRNIPEKIQEF